MICNHKALKIKTFNEFSQYLYSIFDYLLVFLQITSFSDLAKYLIFREFEHIKS